MKKSSKMKFELVPIIDTMCDLYEKPRSLERFQEYISKLQDKKGDMSLPIAGFNPMAKEHILDKLAELKDLKAELVIEETINNLNTTLRDLHNELVIKIVLNVADDLKGAWTNRYTTDYDSKFKINALVARKFCTPFFWASEYYTESLISCRTLEYAYRTIYWLTIPKPKILKQHIEQEIYVAMKEETPPVKTEKAEFELLDEFYSKYLAICIFMIPLIHVANVFTI